jgi:hypothetical protein
MSPYQRITGEPLDFKTDFQFAFGDFLAVNTPKEQLEWKFDAKNQLAIYVGCPENTKSGNLVYWPFSHSTSVRLSCVKIELTDSQLLQYHARLITMREKPLPYSVIEKAVADFRRAELKEVAEQLPEQDWDDLFVPKSVPLVPEPSHVLAPLLKKRRVAPMAIPTERVLRSASSLSASFDDDDPAWIYPVSFESESIFAGAAMTVNQALRRDDADAWKADMMRELNLLFDGGTLVPWFDDMPASYDLIHSTMALKYKLKQDGTLDKIKARLCACGNELRDSGVETYSPTIGALSYVVAHQISIIDQMCRCTVDVTGAYLYQDYPDDAKPIFLTIPENVAVACGLDPTVKYRLRKYMYGLPDSGRAYYKAYSSLLIENGYTRTMSDPCLFTRFTEDSRTYVWIHVDDTFVCSTSPEELIRFQNSVKKKYKITVVENVDEYLGIKTNMLPNGDVVLTQPKLLGNILEEYADRLPTSSRKVAAQRTPNPGSFDSTPFDSHEYRHLLGGLLYIAISRPDISTAVSFASMAASKPCVGDFDNLLHCLLYLSQTKERGLILRSGVSNQELSLKCYVDASYLTHPDSKSHTGYCISFADVGFFYSKSRKQHLVATSSTHAEVRALHTLLIDLIFIINLCRELGRPVKLPAVILEDNRPAIELTRDINARTKRCKHFLMLINFIREHIESGLIALEKVDTKDNIADMLTKILVGLDFHEKAAALLNEDDLTDTDE